MGNLRKTRDSRKRVISCRKSQRYFRCDSKIISEINCISSILRTIYTSRHIKHIKKVKTSFRRNICSHTTDLNKAQDYLKK